MKIHAAAFAAALVVAAGAGALAQGTAAKVKWTWDDKLEAVNAAPSIHKVLFENDHIRLLEVTIHAGEKEPMHGHQYPSVFAIDAPQPAMDNEQLGGKIDKVARRTYASYPTCMTMDVQPPHSAKITENFQQHFFRLEFKRVDGDAIYNMP